MSLSRRRALRSRVVRAAVALALLLAPEATRAQQPPGPPSATRPAPRPPAGAPALEAARLPDVDARLSRTFPQFVERMRRNIEPAFPKEVDGRRIVASPGSVIASPSAHDPDYFFHWVRDSALVMDAVVRLYAWTGDPELERLVERFVDFSARLQSSGVQAGLGEVRFNVDGTPDRLQWSRPQFDGPALRALTLLHYLAARRSPLPPGREQVLREVVRRDLDFVVLNWNRPCFDVWESYTGLYYYTRAVQVGALQAAAPVVRAWGDPARAQRYEQAATALLGALDAHWRTAGGTPARPGAADGFLAYSIGDLRDVNGVPAARPGGGLDAGVVMAAVHAGRPAGPHALDDPLLLATAARLEDLFERLFPINRQDRHGVGTAIGRHEGDQYYGGNPFVFLTAAFAEFYYRLAASLPARARLVVTEESRPFWARVLASAPAPAPPPLPGGAPSATPPGARPNPSAGVPTGSVPGVSTAKGSAVPSSSVPGARPGGGSAVPSTPVPGLATHAVAAPLPGADLLATPAARELLRAALVRRGDETLLAVLQYVPDDGRLAEQYDKATGEPRSAQDLTWSYASVITAALAREDVVGASYLPPPVK